MIKNYLFYADVDIPGRPDVKRLYVNARCQAEADVALQFAVGRLVDFQLSGVTINHPPVNTRTKE